MFYLDPYNHSILKNYHRYCSALEFINQYIFKKPMQSEKAYYRRIAGFFNAGRPVATPAGQPVNSKERLTIRSQSLKWSDGEKTDGSKRV